MVIQPPPTPPVPTEAPELPGAHQVPSHLLLHPVLDEAEAPARVPDGKVPDPAAQDRVDEGHHPPHSAVRYRAPVCGGGDESTAEKITNVPVWAFHGDKDNRAPVDRSHTTVEALKKAGGHPKYTEYTGVGHNSWDRAYAEPELTDWLFAQKRG